jgi:ureidoglycolate dehydrogenase (NAD+)
MTHFFSDGALHTWAANCLQAVQVPVDDAALVADALVQTSLWGIDSHGIARLTHYLARIQAGSIDPHPKLEMTETGPCTAQLNAGHALGIVACWRAMQIAIDLAQRNGLGLVGVSESTHCGSIGLYTRQAAREGLIGIAFTHSDALVAPFGGFQRFLGTNPISIAFPRSEGEPLCLDMATSAIAWNKVMNARRTQANLPDQVAVDQEGQFTTDPQLAKALSPLGGLYGYKGYGLGLAIDLLCGPLNGMPFGPHISAMYGDLSQRRHLGSLLLAIDPHRFAGGVTLAETVAQIIVELKQQPGEILYSGEPEYRQEVERRVSGIPVDAALLAEMNAWSEKLGVSPLSAD